VAQHKYVLECSNSPFSSPRFLVYPYSPTCSHTVDFHSRPLHLALDNSRAGVDVAGRSGPVELEEDAGVGGLVGAGEADELAGVESSRAAGDVDLSAGEVQLGAADAAGAVQGDVLDADQVLAVLDAAGDLDRDFRLACDERLSESCGGTERSQGLGMMESLPSLGHLRVPVPRPEGPSW